MHPILVLELGAGTRGTTAAVLETLHNSGIQFRYFTDIARFFVMAARRRFEHFKDLMGFIPLEIEQNPPSELLGRFDIILSISCIHATRDLNRSILHARQMTRIGGFICLVETTTRLFFQDLIFGLLEGWWLFENGRSHALGSPSF